jgi:hypothetical protein
VYGWCDQKQQLLLCICDGSRPVVISNRWQAKSDWADLTVSLFRSLSTQSPIGSWYIAHIYIEFDLTLVTHRVAFWHCARLYPKANATSPSRLRGSFWASKVTFLTQLRGCYENATAIVPNHDQSCLLLSRCRDHDSPGDLLTLLHRQHSSRRLQTYLFVGFFN